MQFMPFLLHISDWIQMRVIRVQQGIRLDMTSHHVGMVMSMIEIGTLRLLMWHVVDISIFYGSLGLSEGVNIVTLGFNFIKTVWTEPWSVTLILRCVLFIEMHI